MSKTHPIDELFKGRLQEYEMAPPMHLWDAIDQKRKRPKAAYWWFSKYWPLLGLGVLLLGMAGFWGLKSTTLKKPELQYFPIQIQEGSSIADNAPSKPAKEQTSTILPSTTEQNGQSRVAPSSIPLKANSKSKDLTNTNDYSTNILTQSPEVVSIPPPFTSSSPATTTLDSEQAASVATLKKEEEKELQNTQEEVTETRTQWAELLSLSQGPQKLLAEPAMSDQQPNLVSFPSLNGNGIAYFFEAFGSPGFASRNLNPVNESFGLLTEEWQSSQQKQSAFQFGLRVAAVNRKGWSLRTGIHFTQIQESFQFMNHIAETAQVYDPMGGFIREDTIFVPSGAVTNSINQYALLDLPLILGYQKRFQRWTFSANAGPILNLSFQQKGNLINPNRQLIPVEAAEAQDAFRSTLGINWYGSLGIQYELQPGVHLMLEPHLRFQRASFMEAGFPVQQKYLTGGLSVGIRKQLIR